MKTPGTALLQRIWQGNIISSSLTLERSKVLRPLAMRLEAVKKNVAVADSRTPLCAAPSAMRGLTSECSPHFRRPSFTADSRTCGRESLFSGVFLSPKQCAKKIQARWMTLYFSSHS